MVDKAQVSDMGVRRTSDGHADYPHILGSLFDCPACEETCYCVLGETECVRCAIVAERKMNARAIRYFNRFAY